MVRRVSAGCDSLRSMAARQTEWLISKRAAVAEHGMVTAMHPLAAAAGLEILEHGGNAVDAAVATAFAIGVVEPAMSGLGGVAGMVIYLAATGQTVTVDGSSVAPAAARDDTFALDAASGVAGMYGWPATRDDAQNTGYRAPVAPGQPACLLYAHARFGSGRLSRADVLAPAIRLAAEGFDVDTYQAQTIAFAQRRLRAFPETMRAYFLSDGTPPAPASLTHAADRLVQSDLAESLRALAEHGPAALYTGELGERLIADLQAHGGLLTRADLAAFKVRESAPGLTTDYRGYQLVGLSPASGSPTAFEMLHIVQACDLADLEADSAQAVHLVAEACRAAFQDRFAHLADPTQQEVPIAGLLSTAYAAERARGIDRDRARPDAVAGDPWAFQPAELVGATRQPGKPAGDGCTTHINVVDTERNAVALTSTLGESFGSGVVASGTGILLNNGMTWFDPRPGRMNSIQPGRRTLWAPTPTLVLQAGRPVLAIGAPGGRRIMSAVAQSLLNVLRWGEDVQTAVSAPRIHAEGPTTEIDSRYGPEIIDNLRERGHQVRVIDEDSASFRFARPCGIALDWRTGLLTGGVHQFTPAWAMGY